ncbi:phage tail protein [Serratia fonticola]|uniref:phage tail-collar fiber domain-containing protein n=1 Tax=Serratia fonticola TaxID=47917 RepID=UPI003AF3DE12
MTAKFFAILTNQGAAKLANATALGTKLDLTHLAVGDGGGTLPTPNPAQTKLKGEKRRAAINMLSVDPANPHQVIAEQVIPENEGGWWIREIGLFDKDGALIAVANCPETYKPQLQEGSGRTQTIRMVLIVSSTEAVTLKIDPSVVLATRDYVDNAITAHAKSRNHPDASTTEKGFVQLSSSINSGSEALAATPKAVKSAYDLANNALSKTVTADQGIASAVLFTKAATFSGGFTSLSESVLQAKTPGANVMQRFKNMEGVEQGALFSTPATGQMTLRWGGTAHSALFKSDGTVTMPSTLFIGSTPVLKTGDYGLGGLAVGSAWDTAIKAGKGMFLTGSDGAPAGSVFMGLTMPHSTLTDYAFQIASRKDFGFHYRTLDAGVIRPWVRVYDTAYKPTAADVGALDRADFPVGIPQPWPTATAPAGWLKCNGATFDKAKYPLLAAAYPSGRLPDLRGEFIRGADDGRGVDSGRAVLSTQADAVQKFTGKTNGIQHFVPGLTPQGIISQGETVASTTGLTESTGSTGNGVFRINIDASLQIRTATETRPRNIAFNYIVRAA